MSVYDFETDTFFSETEWAERMARLLEQIHDEVGPLRLLLIVQGAEMARLYRAAKNAHLLEVAG